MADEQRFREHHFESFLKRMVICDGTNQSDLENWLERADTAFKVIPTLTIEEAKRGLAKVSSGVLLETQRSYHGDVLADLITHISAQAVCHRGRMIVAFWTSIHIARDPSSLCVSTWPIFA